MAFDAYDFWEKQYDFERERRDTLNTAVSMPIGIVGVLVGAMSFYLPFLRTQFVHEYWIVVWIGAIVFLGLTVYYLVRSYHGYKYGLVPDAQTLSIHYRGLKAFYSTDAAKAEAEFASDMTESFVEAAQKNAVNNLNKSAYLHRATSALIAAGALTLVGGLPFLAGLLEPKEPEIHKVEVVGCMRPIQPGGAPCQTRKSR